jgi:hypothetical protein
LVRTTVAIFVAMAVGAEVVGLPVCTSGHLDAGIGFLGSGVVSALIAIAGAIISIGEK